MLNPAYDVIPFFTLITLHMSSFNHKAIIYELPTFVPNAYLFKRSASSGKERWQVFSEAVREVMSKATSLKLSNQTFKEKEVYQVHLGVKKVRETIKKD